MSRFPDDETSRQRLHEAQRAEAQALSALDTAKRVRERLQAKVDQADAAVDRARVELVRVSGVWRAAQLTNESVKELRRIARADGLTTSQVQ